MKTVTIPVHIPTDVMLALNESEQELKVHIQTALALMLFQEGKLTLGKSIQLSGLSRFEFEKALAKRNISVSELSLGQIESDVAKLGEL
jgi:predicted HTH domain antitoxin